MVLGMLAIGKELTASWISLVAVLAFMFLIAGVVVASRLPETVKQLVCLGLALRGLGALLRYEVLFRFYSGSGDAVSYFGKGLGIADSLSRLEYSSITAGGSWYGTDFVRLVSGIVLLLIGPSIFSEYVVFALFGFVGLIGFGVAFQRAYGTSALVRYLTWIFLFPSLWFWPSSIGKEALVLMGLGLAVMGFVGNGERVRWPMFALGVFLVFAVRPQVVAVFLAAVITAQWLSFEGRWTSRRLLQGMFLLVVGIMGITYAMRTVGLEEFDVEGVQEYVLGDKSREAVGGTSVTAVTPGLKGLPVAASNVLFRPFPWEITNVMVLLSSVEIMSLWIIMWVRRKRLMVALRSWRSDRLLRLTSVFVVLYSVALGLMLVNIGIIARQRVFLFPFLFLLIEAVPFSSIKPLIREQDPGQRGPHDLTRSRKLPP